MCPAADQQFWRGGQPPIPIVPMIMREGEGSCHQLDSIDWNDYSLFNDPLISIKRIHSFFFLKFYSSESVVAAPDLQVYRMGLVIYHFLGHLIDRPSVW